MNKFKRAFPYPSLLLFFSSCSKKVDPDTSLIRNSGNGGTASNVEGFNSETMMIFPRR